MSGGVEGSSPSYPQRPPPQILRPVKRHFPFASPQSCFDPKPESQSYDAGIDPSFPKLTNKIESCNADSGEWATNERCKEATSNMTPASVSGTCGKHYSKEKVSKRMRSMPNIPRLNTGSPNNALTPAGSCRYDSSLGLLTKKFISLIQQTEDATLDLNKAADILEVQKRRIYDITNVLEGVGLIEKTLKNRIRWKGFDTSTPRELEDQISRLKDEVETLYTEDCRLDSSIREMKENLEALHEDQNSQKWLYVTQEDIKNLPCFKNQTVFIVKAPHATTLEVPDPNEDVDYSQRRYQMFLRSAIGPIDCYLVSEHGENLEDLDNDPRSTTDISIENPQNTNNENVSMLLPTIQNSSVLSEVRPGQDGQKTCSDLTNLQDFTGGILKIIPSDADIDTDYWLLSDSGFSVADMWEL